MSGKDIHKIPHSHLGDLVERETPVPIPNTEVKPLYPDDTYSFEGGESRVCQDMNGEFF